LPRVNETATMDGGEPTTLSQSTGKSSTFGPRQMALDACCAALIAIESVRAHVERTDSERVCNALDRAISSLHQAIAALHPKHGEIDADGVGLVVNPAHHPASHRVRTRADSAAPRKPPPEPDSAD
jgi:hypothetical protein